MTSPLPVAPVIDPPAPREIRLPDGQPALLRLIRPEDAAILGTYFERLGAQTRRLYAPHPFDRPTAAALCDAIDHAEAMRFLLTRPTDQGEEVIAYFIVKRGVYEGDRQRYAARGMILEEATTCSLAPSVADEWQSRGVGSVVLDAVLAVVRGLGFRRMILQGGVRAENPRGIRFYEKNGLVRVGDFRVRDLENHDMILILTPA